MNNYSYVCSNLKIITDAEIDFKISYRLNPLMKWLYSINKELKNDKYNLERYFLDYSKLINIHNNIITEIKLLLEEDNINIKNITLVNDI